MSRFMRILVTAFCLCVFLISGVSASPLLYSQPRVTVRGIPFSNGYIENGETPASFIIILEAGKTFTVPEDTTLKLYGTLNIQGTLINNGIIELQAKNVPDNYNDKSDNEDIITALVNNCGTIENNGSFHLVNGDLLNGPKGQFINNGTVSVENKVTNLSGIVNLQTIRGERSIFGTFVNYGDIKISSKVSGIRNQDGAVFENNGVIRKISDAEIKGIITGTGTVTSIN